MTPTFTLLHCCRDGLHLFTVDTFEEAQLLLAGRLRTEALAGDILAIVTGPDDELVYYKRVHKITQSLSSNRLASNWITLKQRALHILGKLSSGVFLPTH